MVAKPATPDLLEVGVIWMMRIDTASSFYRATVSFLDPLCPPGTAGKKRDIPLLAVTRISASACLFASNAHHITRGIIPMDWAQRVRGNYITLEALLHTLKLLHAREPTFCSTKRAHALISVLEPCASNGAPVGMNSDLSIVLTGFPITPGRRRLLGIVTGNDVRWDRC